jgi:hypothetical protein
VIFGEEDEREMGEEEWTSWKRNGCSGRERYWEENVWLRERGNKMKR